MVAVIADISRNVWSQYFRPRQCLTSGADVSKATHCTGTVINEILREQRSEVNLANSALQLKKDELESQRKTLNQLHSLCLSCREGLEPADSPTSEKRHLMSI
jgi:hypothetical protein